MHIYTDIKYISGHNKVDIISKYSAKNEIQYSRIFILPYLMRIEDRRKSLAYFSQTQNTTLVVLTEIKPQF